MRRFVKFIGNHPTVVILIIAFLIRFIFAFPVLLHPERAFEPDSYGYDRLATNVLEKHRFSASEKPPYRPQLLRMPIYPFFLAATYAIFGHKPGIAILLQVLIDVLSCIVIYRIGSTVFNGTLGLIGGCLGAVNPLLILYSTKLLTETVFTFLLLLGIYFFIRFMKEQEYVSLIISCFTLAIASLCRPIALYLFPVVLIFIIFILHKRFGWCLRLIRVVLVSVGIFVLTLFPWYLRNLLVFHKVMLSTTNDYLFFEYRAGAVVASKENISLDEAREKLYGELRRKLSDKVDIDVRQIAFQQPDIAKEAGGLGRKIIKANLIKYAEVHLIGVYYTLHPFGIMFSWYKPLYGQNRSNPDSMESKSTFHIFIDSILKGNLREAMKVIYEKFSGAPLVVVLLGFVSILFILFEYILSVIGIYTLWRGNSRMVLIILMVVVIYLIVTPGPVGYYRFRAPAEPYICLLAAPGIKSLVSSFFKHKSFKW